MAPAQPKRINRSKAGTKVLVKGRDGTYLDFEATATAMNNALNSGDAGLKAYNDFLGNKRPLTGNDRGALLEE